MDSDMAQLTIDLGTAPNDGTGDPIRTAFGKVNDNFTELYALSNLKLTGAVGLEADNTTMFAALEAANPGASVDLDDKVWPLAAFPTGCNYYHGGVSVDGEVYWFPRNPRAHPFENPACHIKTIMPLEGGYAGLSTCLFQVADSPRMVALYRVARSHNAMNGAEIRMAISDDCFNSTQRVPAVPVKPVQRTIYRDASYDTRNCASGVMGSGRLGSVWTRVNDTLPTPAYTDAVFLYCDNADTSNEKDIAWSTVTIPFTAASFNSHGKIHPWPASAGGHDTLGFIFYSYSSNHGICAYTTTDNGATWTEHLDVVNADAPVASVSEMDVARIGSEDKWVMTVRTNANVGVATSTDMLTWTQTVFGGISMLDNPPCLIYDMGKLWLYSFSRRDKSLVPEHANAIVVSCGDPDTVFSSGGDEGWSEWRVVTTATFWTSGYMAVQKVRGRWYGLFTDAEDSAGSTGSRTCYMSLLSPDPPAIASTREILNRIPAPNLIPTGSFMYWPIGTSFASGARTPVLPGMTFARANGAAGATLSRQTGDFGQYKLRMGRDDGNTNANGPTLNIVLTSEDSINLRTGFLTISGYITPGSGFSAANRLVNIRARQTTSAESQVSLATGLFSTGDAAVQSSSTGVAIGTEREFFSITIGPFLDSASVYGVSTMQQALVQIYWACVGTASNDYIDIEQLKIEIGKEPTPFVYPPLQDLKNWSDRFYQTFDVRSINGTIWIPFGQHMHAIPTVTVSAGSAANATTAGFELTHTSAATVTVTASAWL
jgi:hypothetical protein